MLRSIDTFDVVAGQPSELAVDNRLVRLEAISES